MSKRGENIYKRKDGRWEGRYIKCRTLHGRIQYGYVYGKRYSEVKSKLKETASRPIQTSDSRAPQPTSYSEILKMWLLSAKNHVKESTFSRYNHLVERHIQPFLGGYQIGEISNALLEKYIDHLLQCGRLDGSGGLSPKSVSDILVVIKRSMRYAQENNHLVICSTAGLSVKRSRKNMRVLSEIEQQQLEYVLMQDMDLTKFTVLLCLYTGIRIGEACALRWEHIRLDSGILEVRETMQRIQAPENMASKTRIIITEPKSASSNRDIPLPQFLMQYDFLINRDSEDSVEESPIPLVRLTQMLGGVPPLEIKFKAEILREAHKAPRTIYVPIEDAQRERAHKELTAKYAFDGKLPSSILVISVRSKSYQAESLGQSWLAHKESESSEFWKRNHFPSI